MDRSSTAILVTLALCGVLMVVFAALPWLTFSSIEADALDGDIFPDTEISVSGLETSRLRDTEVIGTTTIREEDEWCSCRVAFGDGYVVIALGLSIVAGSVFALIGRRAGAAGSAAAVAGVIALLVAGYNAMADWQAFAWTTERRTEVLEGEPTVWLWSLMAVSAFTAALGAVLWSLARVEEREYAEAEEYADLMDDLPERMNAWA